MLKQKKKIEIERNNYNPKEKKKKTTKEQFKKERKH